jgi:hypothetical protein
MNAIHARSQLRYWPTSGWTPKSSTSFAERRKPLSQARDAPARH